MVDIQQLEMVRAAAQIAAAMRSGTKCCFWIGAGVSVNGNIPAGGGLVALLRSRYPEQLREVSSYEQCMSTLTQAEVQNEISRLIDGSSPTFAQLCLAQLMRDGRTDRVLTTNFDMLLERACGLLGFHSPIYDLVISQTFPKHREFDGGAVYHLHGARSGEVYLNLREHVKLQKQNLDGFFRDCFADRLVVVVGYSGSDWSVDLFGDPETFPFRLFWVDIKLVDQIERNVTERVLYPPKKNSFYIRASADDFFAALLEALGEFPPAFLRDPFSHLKPMLDQLLKPVSGGVPLSERTSKELKIAVGRVRAAVHYLGSSTPSLPATPSACIDAINQTSAHLYAGDFDWAVHAVELIAQFEASSQQTSLGVAFFQLANSFATSLKELSLVESRPLLGCAERCYEKAHQIRGRFPGALYNHAVTLQEFAWREFSFDAAQSYFSRARTLLKQGMKEDPKDPDFPYFLARVCTRLLVKTTSTHPAGPDGTSMDPDEEKHIDELFQEAQRLGMKEARALHGWGVSQQHRARLLPPAEATLRLSNVRMRIEEALKGSPSDVELNVAMGVVRMDLARLEPAERDNHFDAAYRCFSFQKSPPGGDFYNQACLENVRADLSNDLGRERVAELLENVARVGGLPRRGQLLTDPDLASIRDLPWFRLLLEKANE